MNNNRRRLAVEDLCEIAFENDRTAASFFGLHSLLELPTRDEDIPDDPKLQRRMQAAIQALRVDKDIGQDYALASYADAFVTAGKQVYDLDRDFAKSISEENWMTLLPELYDMWPYDAFYLMTNSVPGYEGHIVSIGANESDKPGRHDHSEVISTNRDGTIALVKYTSKNDGDFALFDIGTETSNHYLVTDYGADNPVYHCIETLAVGRRDDGGVKAGGWRHVPGYHETLLNLLAYICSANADINTVYTPPKPVKGKRPNKAKDRKRSMCTVHQVGYHIGAELRAYERRLASAEAVDSDSDGEKRSVRPHMRRAHWHHYWTGPRDVPEERQLVIRWIAPTFVGNREEFDGKPTVHKVH